MNQERDQRPGLLFVSPTYPDSGGNGLAMRAGMFVEALAQRYRVSVLVVPLFARPSAAAEVFARRYCNEYFVVSPEEPGLFRRLREGRDRRPPFEAVFERHVSSALRTVAGREYDVVHVFRLYMSALGLGIAMHQTQSPQLHLDLDDIESQTAARLAALRRLNGDASGAASEDEMVRRYVMREAELLPRFDRVYVCSQADATAVAALGATDVRIVPNAVRPPSIRVEERDAGIPFRFIFVGNLDYYPNRDGLLWFCSDILPALRSAADTPFRLRIVGAGLTPEVAALASHPEVEIGGEVENVSVEYNEADAVIVPLRAGGGTRIKVLEAFAHLRPVVSTTIGVEGIEAVRERHLLVADTPEAFAGACVRLIQDGELRRSLTKAALALVTQDYSQDAVNRLIAGWS